MRPREVYMHLDLLDVVPKSGPQRRLIMEFVRSLRDSPATTGDSTDKDSSLRERQIKVIGDYAITYWFDAIMVVDVRRADH